MVCDLRNYGAPPGSHQKRPEQVEDETLTVLAIGPDASKKASARVGMAGSCRKPTALRVGSSLQHPSARVTMGVEDLFELLIRRHA